MYTRIVPCQEERTKIIRAGKTAVFTKAWLSPGLPLRQSRHIATFPHGPNTSTSQPAHANGRGSYLSLWIKTTRRKIFTRYTVVFKRGQLKLFNVAVVCIPPQKPLKGVAIDQKNKQTVK